MESEISPKEEAFIVAYLDEAFLKGAAYEAGISERTARRWLADPRIQRAIEQLRQERRRLREDRIAMCMDLAINVLQDNLTVLSDPDEANRTHNHLDHDLEFKYVALMLRYAHDQREVDVLRARVAELEAKMAETGEKAAKSGQKRPLPIGKSAKSHAHSSTVRH